MNNTNDQILEKKIVISEDRISVSLRKSTLSEFDEYLKNRYKDEFSTFSDEEKIKKFEIVFSQALRIMKNEHKENQLHQIMWGDKIARIDVVKKIGHIMWEFKQHPSFPRIPPMTTRSYVKKIVGNGNDSRYVKKYNDCVMSYCAFDKHMNYVDVTVLNEMIPEDLITKKIFWDDV